MSMEEIDDTAAGISNEVADAGSLSTPIETAELKSEAAAETTSKWGLNRRKFLTAAALGTAAAAMLNKGSGGYLHLGPASALADDLSGLGCTANDVRIVGPGIILNEPCDCTGKFDAEVEFHIINNTGTTRYCVTVHLCPGFNANGQQIFPQTDIVVGDIPANFDGPKKVTIKDYPCGAGLVCFGAAGSQPDGSFLKGEACPSGKCCTTITWNVKASDPCPDTTRQITSKCRHQQVCIQGRGKTTISCPNNNCSVPCAGNTTLTVCTSEPASEGPFIFELRSGGALVERFPASGTTTDTCHAFTVSPTADTTYFGRCISTQDNPDCVKDSTSVTVTVTAITVTLSVSGDDSCGSGNLTFTGSTGKTGCTYNFSVDGTSVQNTTSNTYNYPADPDSQCHTVSVVATCGGCVSNTASKKIKQCVNTTAC